MWVVASTLLNAANKHPAQRKSTLSAVQVEVSIGVAFRVRRDMVHEAADRDVAGSPLVSNLSVT